MKKVYQAKKEILVILASLITITMFAVSSKIYSLYNINLMHEITDNIFEHPLKVSNASLKVQLEIYKMHRDMKDILLTPTKDELEAYVLNVNTHEQNIYRSLKIIEENILGEKGLLLLKQTRELFIAWKPIRDEVIELSLNGNFIQAVKITKGKGAVHVLKLDEHASKLYNYAKNKANEFKAKSDSIVHDFLFLNLSIDFLVLVIFALITYYVINRVSKYMYKNELLNDELTKKSENLKTMIEEAPNPIMLHNEDGNVILVNNVFKDITGYSFDEINTIDKWIKKAYGVKINEVKDDIEKLYSMDKKIDEGKYKITTKNGNKVIWQLSSVPLGIIDGKKTIITSAMDITELVKKDELMMIQSRYAAMGEMIAMIAHQWRQPLAIISMDVNNMLIDIELNDLKESSVKDTSYSILSQTEYLTNTIDDFRNFFLPNSKKENISIQDILEDTKKMLLPSLAAKEIKILFDNEKETFATLHKQELIQVLINLINNSKNALLENTKENRYIEISVEEDEKNITINLYDNGGGIDESIKDKIFDAYFSKSTNLNGTGLGLYMSKTIITKHFNGSIHAFNKNGGACFSINFPKNKS